MTKQEAYERLELPEGADLQEVRRKFAEVYNDYQMRIDNPLTPRMRQIYERHLESAKEAYALLNESEGLDDKGDLPHTGPIVEERETNGGAQDTDPQQGEDRIQWVLPPVPWFPRSAKWLGGLVLLGLALIFVLLPGRGWGSFVQLLWAVFAPFVAGYVVYNNFAARPVPAWLSGKAFRGWWAVATLAATCVAGFVLVYVAYAGGRAVENNAYIHWDYYTGYRSAFIGLVAVLTALVFVIFGLIALIQPRIVGFDHRGRVIASGALLFLYAKMAAGSVVLLLVLLDFDRSEQEVAFSTMEHTDFPELQKQLNDLCERVVFEYDSSVLPKESQEAVDEIGRLIKNAEEGQHFTLYAHYNEGGIEQYSMEVSKDRAQRIRSYWVRMGVEPTAVDYSGMGS